MNINQPINQPMQKEAESGKAVPVTVADNQAVGGEDQLEFGWKEHHRPSWALQSPIQDVFCRYGGYYS